jgi:hypothetical protein
MELLMGKRTFFLAKLGLGLTYLILSPSFTKANPAACESAALKGKTFCEENSGCGLLPASEQAFCKEGCELMLRAWTAYCNSHQAK